MRNFPKTLWTQFIIISRLNLTLCILLFSITNKFLLYRPIVFVYNLYHRPNNLKPKGAFIYSAISNRIQRFHMYTDFNIFWPMNIYRYNALTESILIQKSQAWLRLFNYYVFNFTNSTFHWRHCKLEFNRAWLDGGRIRRIAAEFRKLLSWWLHSTKVEDSSSNVWIFHLLQKISGEKHYNESID